MVSSKRINLIFLLYFLCNNIHANRFAVWQGFEHKWKYNHRLNRLGDYIAQAPEQPNASKYFSSVHTGATGLGRDSASFNSYFSTIKFNDINYFPGIETFKVEGKQNNYFEHTRTVFVPKNYIQNKTDIVSILNGFDIISNAGADKMQMLNIDISDVQPSNKQDTLQFKIKISFVFNCTSFECNRFNKKFDYQISIRYLLLGSDKNKILSTTIPYHHTLSWTKKEYLSTTSFEKTLPTHPNFNSAFLAYKQINVMLNTDHWFVSFANAIAYTNYNFQKNKIDFKSKCYFKQWESGMQKTSNQSKFSSAKAGWGIITGKILLVELKNATINNYIQNGCIFWNGKNKKPNSNTCVNMNQLEIK